MKRIIDERLADRKRRGAAAGQEPLSRGSLAAGAAEPRRAVRVGGPRRGHVLWRPRGRAAVGAAAARPGAGDRRAAAAVQGASAVSRGDHVLNLAYNAALRGAARGPRAARRDGLISICWAPSGFPIRPRRATAPRLHPRPTCKRRHEAYDAAPPVWSEQPPEFFAEALVEADGTLVETAAECKQGIDLNYQGRWGYHPLVLTLANTGEVLRLVNRSGNRPSHEGAAEQFDQCPAVPRGGLPADLAPRRHRLLADRRTSIVGMPRGRAVRVRPGRHRRAARGGRRSAGHGLETLEKAGENPGFRPIAGPARAGQAARRAARLQGPPPGRRGSGRAALSATALPHDLSAGDRPQRTCKSASRGRGGCSRTIATSSISPTTGRARRSRSCSRPTNGVSRRTCWRGLKEVRLTPVDLLSNEAYMVMTSLAWNLKAWLAALAAGAAATRAQHGARRLPAAKQRLLVWVPQLRELLDAVAGGGGEDGRPSWCGCWPGTPGCRSSFAWRSGCGRRREGIRCGAEGIVPAPSYGRRRRNTTQGARGARPTQPAVTAKPRREPRFRPTTPTNRTPPPPAADQPRCANPSPNNDAPDTLD